MDQQLLKQAMIKLISGIVMTALLVFGFAGTLRYPQGWLLMAVLFIPMTLAGIVMMFKAPDLLRKRLEMKETESTQKYVILLSGLLFVAVFALSGICFRKQWLMLPKMMSYVASVIFLAGYGLFAEVLRENAYLSRSVEVQEDQEVIDSGLYGIVRHPMYMSTIILFLAMPAILGSLLGTVLMLLYIPIIAARIDNEEKVLEEGLKGYREYKQKVRYKCIPGIW